MGHENGGNWENPEFSPPKQDLKGELAELYQGSLDSIHDGAASGLEGLKDDIISDLLIRRDSLLGERSSAIIDGDNARIHSLESEIRAIHTKLGLTLPDKIERAMGERSSAIIDGDTGRVSEIDSFLEKMQAILRSISSDMISQRAGKIVKGEDTTKIEEILNRINTLIK